jgi:hypothetical protein
VTTATSNVLGGNTGSDDGWIELVRWVYDTVPFGVYRDDRVHAT